MPFCTLHKEYAISKSINSWLDIVYLCIHVKRTKIEKIIDGNSSGLHFLGPSCPLCIANYWPLSENYVCYPWWIGKKIIKK